MWREGYLISPFSSKPWNSTVGKINNKYIPGNPAHIPKFTSHATVIKPNTSGWSITYAKLFQMILFSKTHLSCNLCSTRQYPHCSCKKQQMTLMAKSHIRVKGIQTYITSWQWGITNWVHDQLILASVGNMKEIHILFWAKRLPNPSLLCSEFLCSNFIYNASLKTIKE